MDCSIAGFLVLHYLLEFVQTYIHWVDEAIQPSHLVWVLIMSKGYAGYIEVYKKKNQKPTLTSKSFQPSEVMRHKQQQIKSKAEAPRELLWEFKG